MESRSSGNFKSRDGDSAQMNFAFEPDALDSKSKGAVFSIAIPPGPERTSKSTASKHPTAPGGKNKTSFVPDLDTGSRRKSHHYLAIFSSWYFGVAFVFLWNAILNAGDYFYSVFPMYHPARVFPLLYIPVALVITAWYLVSSRNHDNIRWRVLIGFSSFFFAGVLLILVSAVNTAGVLGPLPTFIAIGTIILVTSIGEGISGGGLFGEFSFMDPVYMQALNAGTSASGIATTGLRMITKYMFTDSPKGLRNGALSFFAISALVQMVCIFLYAFVFPNLDGVKKDRRKAVAEASKTASGDGFKPAEEESGGRLQHSEMGERQWSKTDLFFENWDYALDLLMVYLVTMCIIPGFLYENTRSRSLGSWYQLVLLAFYTAPDFLIRIVRIERLFMRSRQAIAVCSSGLVLLFIPAFYFGAIYIGPWMMMLLCGLLGTTNGYFTVCIFDNALVGFKSPEQSTIGTILYIAMLTGILIGLGADWLWQIP